MNRTSPCVTCVRAEEDKNACASICKRLDAYQRSVPWEGLPIPVIKEKRVEQAQKEKAVQKVCEVDGCDRPIKAQRKCGAHYDAWRQGSLPGYPPYKRVRPRVQRKVKAKPKKTKRARKVIQTLPDSQIVLDLSRYPKLRDMVFVTAQKFFVTPEHVLIGLAGEALAAKKK